MGYAMEGGMPIVSSGNDGFGAGGIGALLIGALLFGGGLGGLGARGAVGTDLAMQNQINMLSDQISSQGINSELNGIEAQLNNYNTANLQGIASNAQLYQQGNANIAAAIERGNFTTLNSINGLGRDVIVNSNQQSLQQLNSFNQLSTTMLQGFNEVGRDQAQSFNQIIMGQNTLSAQLAACCCDLKSTITADGNLTRALINDIRLQELQGQLTDAKSTINSLNIINALKPPTVVV